MDRLSTLDPGYITGELSIYPHGIDSQETLYEVKNNAQTTLRQSLAYAGRTIIVDSTKGFPLQGLLRIGPSASGDSEEIYYGSLNSSGFTQLLRGFAGSKQVQWPVNSGVVSGVMSEHHNAIKDAIINIETTLGTRDNPDPNSLNGILIDLETRFLAPKPLFYGFPLKGTPPLKVRFQNFTGGEPIRYLWDFGDGTQSTDQSPTHTYHSEGIFSVKLNVLTVLGAQGIETKNNYVKVSAQEGITFFYSEELSGVSIDTSLIQQTTATTFTLVDQTDGPIVERIWTFDDGNRITIEDPNEHTIHHQYKSPGTYKPQLIVILDNQRLKRIVLEDGIRVT